MHAKNGSIPSSLWSLATGNHPLSIDAVLMEGATYSAMGQVFGLPRSRGNLEIPNKRTEAFAKLLQKALNHYSKDVNMCSHLKDIEVAVLAIKECLQTLNAFFAKNKAEVKAMHAFFQRHESYLAKEQENFQQRDGSQTPDLSFEEFEQGYWEVRKHLPAFKTKKAIEKLFQAYKDAYDDFTKILFSKNQLFEKVNETNNFTGSTPISKQTTRRNLLSTPPTASWASMGANSQTLAAQAAGKAAADLASAPGVSKPGKFK